eukprot:CAMPEP_0202904044 /NCGR_PEP_ID=MMETSP1392-20130828/27639_1 /ASSEMBLY_ACC=CAM_ASM_000868 /TAXON_ID=225041 /ORGANISM="Chlamydomonas chlamydogama, Strain SAG 11-48b" /LENGTH=303 /DNA_ID=CAMNT_0049591497 /DNA_START=125 /DNA_END=1034 /DNA_ORIENTATION=+
MAFGRRAVGKRAAARDADVLPGGGDSGNDTDQDHSQQAKRRAYSTYAPGAKEAAAWAVIKEGKSLRTVWGALIHSDDLVKHYEKQGYERGKPMQTTTVGALTSQRVVVPAKPAPMRRLGWQTYLTPEEEQALVDSISRHQDANMPLTRVQVSIMVMRIVARLPRSNPGVQKWIECGRPSNKWFQGFLQRHPDLSLRRAVDSEAAEAEAAAAKNTIVQQAAEVPVPQPREAVASESSDDDACTDSEVEEEQEEAEQRDVAATVACMVDAVAAEVQAAAVTATAAAATAVTATAQQQQQQQQQEL